MSAPAGRHFLQIPGPTNVPDRVLRAMDMPTMDHRGPEFAQLTLEILARFETGFQDLGRRGYISSFWYRGMGSGAGQHPVFG